MDLREKVAEVLRGEAVAEILDQQKQSGQPQYVECTEGWSYIVDGTVDFDKLGEYLADRILAIPEIAARDWQPIETAPKDGAWFVALPRAEMGFGAAEGFDPYPPTVCHIKVSRGYDHRNGVETDRFDVHCKAMNCGTMFALADFTHWMPLPDPPAKPLNLGHSISTSKRDPV